MRKKMLMLSVLLLLFAGFGVNHKAAAESDYLAPDFDPSNYENTEVRFETDDVEMEGDHPHIKVKQIQVVRNGEGTSEDVTYDPIERNTFLTIKLEITADDEKLAVHSPRLETISGLTDLTMLEDYSSMGEKEERYIKPQDTEDITVTFVSNSNGRKIEDMDILRLHPGIEDNTSHESVIVPVKKDKQKIANHFGSGIYPDPIKEKGMMQKDNVKTMDYDASKTISDIAKIRVTGLEVSKLKESKARRAIDMVTTTIKPGNVSMTFPVESEALTDEPFTLLINPALKMNGQTYAPINDGDSSLFLSTENIKGEEAERTYVSFIVNQDDWEKAEHFRFSPGPVYNQRLEPMDDSNRKFHLSKEDKE